MPALPTLTALYLYPIKSCAGIALTEATATNEGLLSQRIYDRQWMVVNPHGAFLTQRDYPRMALIQSHIETDVLEVRAPGMPRLELPLDLPHSAQASSSMQVQIWGANLMAYDCGNTTATWFSQALDTPCKLVRFNPAIRRLGDMQWTQGREVPTLFADGFPYLITSEASLEDLNEKSLIQERAPLPMDRFRPNLVIDGIHAFEEDYAEVITIGRASLKPIKPCPRCAIPSVNQASGEIGPSPLDILQTYRANPIVDGGITFGMNAMLLDGEGQTLRVGQSIDVVLAFKSV